MEEQYLHGGALIADFGKDSYPEEGLRSRVKCDSNKKSYQTSNYSSAVLSLSHFAHIIWRDHIYPQTFKSHRVVQTAVHNINNDISGHRVLMCCVHEVRWMATLTHVKRYASGIAYSQAITCELSMQSSNLYTYEQMIEARHIDMHTKRLFATYILNYLL